MRQQQAKTFPSTYVKRQTLRNLAACYEARRQTKTEAPKTVKK